VTDGVTLLCGAAAARVVGGLRPEETCGAGDKKRPVFIYKGGGGGAGGGGARGV